MAIFSMLIGSGLIIFWCLVGLRKISCDEIWPGHRNHELSFALPDVCVGVVLVISGFLELGDVKAAISALRIWSAGGLFFLGALDAAYLARTWAMRPPGLQIRTLILTVAAFLSSAVLFTGSALNS